MVAEKGVSCHKDENAIYFHPVRVQWVHLSFIKGVLFILISMFLQNYCLYVVRSTHVLI